MTMPKADDPKSIEQTAAINFVPWVDSPDIRPPSNADWHNPMLVTLRLAYTAMLRTKRELMGIWDSDEALAQDSAERFSDLAKELRMWAGVADAASARVIVAGAAVVARNDLMGGRPS